MAESRQIDMRVLRDGYEERYGYTYRSYIHDWRGASVLAHHKKHLVFLIPDEELRLLDVGCGSGYALSLLREKEKIQAYGIDFSLNALRRAQMFAPVVQGDALHLPVRGDYFDIVTLIDVIEHVPDKQRLLAECYRVLKQGGHLFISMPNKSALFYKDPSDRTQPFDESIDLKTLCQLVKGRFRIRLIRGFQVLPSRIERNMFIIERIARRLWFLRDRAKFLVVVCEKIGGIQAGGVS